MAPSAEAQRAYRQAESRFIAQNPRSKGIYAEATESLPGGNTRSVLFYSPFPISIAKAEGSKLYDEDGHRYIDLLGEYTAGLYGHSDPVIIKAISQAARRGLSFGSHHEDESKLAALIKERFPSVDLLRFTNSGTEATLMALAAAKAFTGKNKIMVFDGAYHGGAFSFKSGKSSKVNAPYEYIIARYNDLSSVESHLVEMKHAGDLAAIIVEPMTGSAGAIPGDPEFLLGLREVATKHDAVLIFDEVMTSRMHRGGGIQSQMPTHLRPDMTTFGKYIGGGMSFGAFGGKKPIMELFDPRRSDALAHAGTFNNNVLTMAAGRAGLQQVFTPERAEELHTIGESVRKRLREVSRGTLMKVTGYGSIMCFHFVETPLQSIKSAGDVAHEDTTLAGLFHFYLLERGFYIARRGFVALSLALSEAELALFVKTVELFLSEYHTLLIETPQKPRL